LTGFCGDVANALVTETVAKNRRQSDAPFGIDAVLVCAEEFHEKPNVPSQSESV